MGNTSAKRPTTLTDARSSVEFMAFVEDRRTAAQRKADDHQATVDKLTADKARAKADYETTLTRIDAEIADLHDKIADEQDIVWRAETMLGLERAPVELTPPKGTPDK